MSTAFVYEATRVKASPSALVLDLECVNNWTQIDEPSRDKLTRRWREAEQRLPLELRGDPKRDPRTGGALDPWTGAVVCVAMLDPHSQLGRCLYVGDDAVVPIRAGWRFEAYATERDLLLALWATLDRHPDTRVVGFNSRNFDGAYLFVRSFVLDVECTMNLVPYRYSTKEHLDLYDVLGVWGARGAPGLDAVCGLVGIPTPKKHLDGSQVQAAWDAGRIAEIAQYCAEDVVATTEIFHRWERTVGKVFGERRRW